MNLPVILDIAIGLAFIYLIASLLASEIQELTATILQWRAKHLRESIQNLLAGGQRTAQDDRISDFLEAIYSDPLIRNMNQSSRGIIGSVGQWFYRHVLYRNQHIFGNETSAPSYIAPETFATALLERIGMGTLIVKLTEIRLEKFVGRIVGLYDVQYRGTEHLIQIPTSDYFQDKDYREKGSIRVLTEKARSLSHEAELGTTAQSILTLDSNPDFKALVEEYDDLLNDFRSGEADLETCVERMKEGLEIYISQISLQLAQTESIPQNAEPLETVPISDPSSTTTFPLAELEKQQLHYFKKRLLSFKGSTFGEGTERAITSGKLKPTLVEIAEVFDRASMTYQEIEGAYKDIAAAYSTGRISQEIKQFLVAANTYLDPRQATSSQSTKSILKTLPNRPLTVADLANPIVHPALDEIAQHLSSRERQIYKDWQLYQQSFTRIILAIATYLQSLGKLWLGDTEFLQPATESDLNTLHDSVKESLKKLDPSDRPDLNQQVLAQLDAIGQQTYRGWQIYQAIILEVTRDIAYGIQEEERLFDPKTHQEFKQALSELDDADLYQAVQYSLNLMSNEERQLRLNAAAKKLTSEQRKIYTNYQTYEQIQILLSGVPVPVKQSLASLARRAQTKVKQTQDQLDQFNSEVSRWFDRSMSRASGVYKRNAKGVAIIIGFLIALAANADTFHVVARLSGDDDLRQIIANRAGSITQNATAEDLYSRDKLRALKRDTDAVLQEISLPLRWTPENLSQQFNCPALPASSQSNTPLPTPSPSPTPIAPNVPTAPAIAPTNPVPLEESNSWQSFYQTCLKEKDSPAHFDLFRIASIAIRPQNLVDSGRMLIGWLVSGLAIAMGAPFWFDILSKIMNVRNTGSKPAPVADRETTKTGS